MKIIRRGIISWATLEVLEEDAYEYEGELALAKSSGSPPQPVDPYQQAAAQYGLSTGTAAFNAALNRPNISNPLGSTTWNVTGQSAPFNLGGPSSGGAPSTPSFNLGPDGQIMPNVTAGPGASSGANPFGINLGGGAPIYTESTQLAPQFNSVLEQPIDTSGLPGMPGGPSITDALGRTQGATFGQEMGYLAPQEALQKEQLDSQLAAQGIGQGTQAWDNSEGQLSRQQGLSNQEAADSAILAGNQEEATLFGLGSQGLQNQIALRNAPINEFNALNGAPGATATAMTPDISSAFNNQYQGELAGYNANVASNNQTNSTLGSLGSAALMAAIFASDRRLKTDIREEGRLPTGPHVYSYRWKGDPTQSREVGLIAQDVEKTHPDAVFSLGGRRGTKVVDYARATAA